MILSDKILKCEIRGLNSQYIYNIYICKMYNIYIYIYIYIYTITFICYDHIYHICMFIYVCIHIRAKTYKYWKILIASIIKLKLNLNALGMIWE